MILSSPRRSSRALATTLAVVALAGCTADGEPEPAPTVTTSDDALPVVDEDAERLAGLVLDIRATVTALRVELEAAAEGDAAALDDAVALLVADVDAATTVGGGGLDPDQVDGADDGSAPSVDGADADSDADDPVGGAADVAPPGDGPAPLLPGPLESREESILYGDLLTRTLATARGAGGDGELVQRFLADPLAGDLGAWQRAPDDQLDAIALAGTTPDLDDAGTAILALDGDAPRALAWVVHGLTVPADAADAAGRALAHLAVIELALEQLP